MTKSPGKPKDQLRFRVLTKEEYAEYLNSTGPLPDEWYYDEPDEENPLAPLTPARRYL